MNIQNNLTPWGSPYIYSESRGLHLLEGEIAIEPVRECCQAKEHCGGDIGPLPWDQIDNNKHRDQ